MPSKSFRDGKEVYNNGHSSVWVSAEGRITIVKNYAPPADDSDYAELRLIGVRHHISQRMATLAEERLEAGAAEAPPILPPVAWWAINLLTPRRLQDAVLGDIEEKFGRISRERGEKSGRWWVRMELAKLVGHGLIQLARVLLGFELVAKLLDRWAGTA